MAASRVKSVPQNPFASSEVEMPIDVAQGR